MASSPAAAFHILPTPNPKLSIPALNPRISHSTPLLFLNPPRLLHPLRRHQSFPSRPCPAVQDTVFEDPTVQPESEPEKKRKLLVVNLPWSHSAPDTGKLFSECGTVKKVEIIKRKNGQTRGFAFVTMASGDEAQAVIDKFDSSEVLGRMLKVEFAKKFRKPSPPAPPGVPVVETRYQIYASNLAWEVRACNLREIFSSKFKPVSARVVFDNQRSAGYGFVSFATMEEAEAAVSELDGKELIGRPLRLKISQKKGEEARSEPEEVESTEALPGDT